MASPPEFTVPEGFYPPFAIISDSDHGGWIIIAATLGLAIVLLSSCIRIYLRTQYRNQSGVDDAFLAAATVFAIVQQIIILIACDKGLGRSIELLSSSALASVEKLLYTAQILAVFPIGLSKCSLAIFILRLTPNEWIRRIVYGVLLGIVLWIAGSVLAFALVCNLSRPWEFVGEHCPAFGTRVLVIGIFDILFEVVLFAVSFYLVFSLRIAFQKKIMVLMAFGMRLPIIAFVVARIVSFDQKNVTSNFSLAADFYIIWTETEINYCLISTTLPVVRPFIKDLSTYYGGRWYSDSPSASRSNSYPLFAVRPKPLTRSRGYQRAPTVQRSYEQNAGPNDGALLPNDGFQRSLLIPDVSTVGGGLESRDDDICREQDNGKSHGGQRLMIRLDTEWIVERDGSASGTAVS